MKMYTPKGVTLVETLLAVAISAVGIAAVFSLQISTIQGNIASREVTAAVNLAEGAVATFQRESYKWIQPEPPEPYLNQAIGQWHTLTPDPVDQNGRVSPIVDSEKGSLLRRQRFCVHYYVERLTRGYFGLISGRVRVVWPFAALGDVDLAPACGADTVGDFQPLVGEWYSFSLPFVVRAGGRQ